LVGVVHRATITAHLATGDDSLGTGRQLKGAEQQVIHQGYHGSRVILVYRRQC
jgi:hypothetical protein